MTKKVALKYLPNNFEVVKMSFVICAVSGKEIGLEISNYWNVELREPYYSYIEAHQRVKK